MDRAGLSLILFHCCSTARDNFDMASTTSSILKTGNPGLDTQLKLNHYQKWYESELSEFLFRFQRQRSPLSLHNYFSKYNFKFSESFLCSQLAKIDLGTIISVCSHLTA